MDYTHTPIHTLCLSHAQGPTATGAHQPANHPSALIKSLSPSPPSPLPCSLLFLPILFSPANKHTKKDLLGVCVQTLSQSSGCEIGLVCNQLFGLSNSKAIFLLHNSYVKFFNQFPRFLVSSGPKTTFILFRCVFNFFLFCFCSPLYVRMTD